jgi:putative NADH-flavin reductase
MKIALLGANGNIGQAIVHEAFRRDHLVTAAIRFPYKMPRLGDGLTIVETDVRSAASVAHSIEGHDAVVSALGGLGHDNPRIVIESAPAVVEAMTTTGVRRLVIVGTSGTLRAANGVEVMNQPDFPDLIVDEAVSQRDVELYLRSLDVGEIQWTYLSPPWDIEPGERTGKYRLGRDDMLYDEDGRSYISNADFAVALLDELEHPKHIGMRFTVAS